MDVLFDTVIPWAITTICSGIIGFLIARLKSMKRRDDAIEQGLRVLLGKTLIDSYDLYHNQERKLTVERKREIDEAYKAYHALGGNGTITALYKDLTESAVWIERS